ncbi:conserved hypothetical protein [Candida dubliniensis CD36]|uniref:Uncharacterized protein n=1 Tax=Candida dubliniensis (strain CD36 / ATCC MYA-646 / CBS 7987 / NCPF 3949 / NRRL Y-17841) TaxID=573826 RepID=B9WHH1_CANDC|nr:conserved hypothetical protein [Candida dubliniensis CD36]CAX41613.1 conserved hypothetical protein [Candida dubliniensis CD36]
MSIKIDHIIKSSKELYPQIIEELSSQFKKKYDKNTKTFEQLNTWKEDELTNTLLKRYQQTGTTWITKDELVNLLDWKLAKGKFRPMLPKLIKSNDSLVVEETTKQGYQFLLDYFKLHSNSKKQSQSLDKFWGEAKDEDKIEYSETIKKSFEKFSLLKGVGPAMASLLGSLVIKINPYLTPPFFSEESFLFYYLESFGSGEKVKYNMKEYIEELLPVYFEIITQHPEVTMDTLERGGWALKAYQIQNDDKLANIETEYTDEDTDRLKLEHKPDLKLIASAPRRKKQKK